MGNFPYGPRLPAELIMFWCIFLLPWWEVCCCCSDMFIWMNNYNVHSVKLKMVGSVRHDKPSSRCRCLTAWSATASVFWLRGDVLSRKNQRQGQGCCCSCCSAVCQRNTVSGSLQPLIVFAQYILLADSSVESKNSSWFLSLLYHMCYEICYF